MTPRPPVFYFAYGSNLPRARLEARLGSVEVRATGYLKGYQLRFHKRGGDGSGKCDAFSSGVETDEVHGAVFVLDASQLERLDGFEGSGYARRATVVHCAHGKLDALTYVALEHAIGDGLQPFDWYLALVRHGAREHRLPAWYRARLDDLDGVADVDAERARQHFNLIPANTRSPRNPPTQTFPDS